MMRPEEAWTCLEPYLHPLASETIALQAAHGRVLAGPLNATLDVPGTDVSAMDGFAVAGAVVPGEPVPITGSVFAGDRPGLAVAQGQAARIMTGATVPRGADRIIPVELAEVDAATSDTGAPVVRFSRSTETGAHIRRRAEIMRRGEALLGPGELLTPGALGLVATHGISRVEVHRAPRVAVLATGDEVVSPEEEPQPGQLRNSNTPFLVAAGAGLGLAFTSLGIAADRRDDLHAKIEAGMAYDILLLSGGVSMGEHDLVEGVLQELGASPLFDAVAMQPGKPLVAAHHAGGLIFGLPGNPASVMVAFWLFVRPALRRLLGLRDGFWHGALGGRLVSPAPGAKDRDRFLPAEVSFEGTLPMVSPRPPRGSHDLAAYGGGTALLRIRPNAEPAAAGAACEILPLADWRLPNPRTRRDQPEEGG